MGAPFWFDMLTRLVGAKGNRGVPSKAAADNGSATTTIATTGEIRARQPFFTI